MRTEKGQALYFSQAWREGEKATRKALARGQGKTFRDAEEAIRWLSHKKSLKEARNGLA